MVSTPYGRDAISFEIASETWQAWLSKDYVCPAERARYVRVYLLHIYGKTHHRYK